jgi:hypothetical protein
VIVYSWFYTGVFSYATQIKLIAEIQTRAEEVVRKAAGEADHDFSLVALNSPPLPGVNVIEGQHMKHILSKFLDKILRLVISLGNSLPRSSDTSGANT